MTYRSLAVLLVSFGVSPLSAQKVITWYHPEKSHEVFRFENQQCERWAQANVLRTAPQPVVPSGRNGLETVLAGVVDIARDEVIRSGYTRDYTGCMRKLGWSTEQPQLAPAAPASTGPGPTLSAADISDDHPPTTVGALLREIGSPSDIGDEMVNTAGVRGTVRVTFTGRTRAIPSWKRASVTAATEHFIDTPDPSSAYVSEIEVRSGNTPLWVAIQEVLLPPWRAEVAANAGVDLLVTGWSVITRATGPEYVVLMFDFRAVSQDRGSAPGS